MARLLGVTAIVFGLAATLFAQGPRISGSITYRERVALPSTAVVEVSLEDVSRADGPAPVIAMTRIENAGQVPIEFDLPYDAARIDASRRYAVRARILHGDRVWFATTGSALVVTQGHGRQVQLVLASADAPAAPAPSAAVPLSRPVAPLAPPIALTGLPATFVGTLPCADCQGIRYQLNLNPDDSFFVRTTYVGKAGAAPKDEMGSWVLSSDRRAIVLKGMADAPEFFSIRDGLTLRKLDVEGRDINSSLSYTLRRSSEFQPLDTRMPMRGSYREAIGGRGEFTECSTGQQWPAVVDAAVTSAYRGAAKRAGDPVLMSIEGHLAVRPPVERQPAETAVVIESVARASATETCAPRFAGTPLENTFWRLTRLGDTAVASSQSTSTQPGLTLRSEANSFSGSAGCHKLAGNYASRGEGLTFAGVGTLKACAGSAEIENTFRSALTQTVRYRVLGNVLELYDPQNKELARFEARR